MWATSEEEDKVVYIKSRRRREATGDVVTVYQRSSGLGVDKIGLVADKKKRAAKQRQPPQQAKPA